MTAADETKRMSWDVTVEPPNKIIQLAKRRQKELDEDVKLEDVVFDYLGQIKIDI